MPLYNLSTRLKSVTIALVYANNHKCTKINKNNIILHLFLLNLVLSKFTRSILLFIQTLSIHQVDLFPSKLKPYEFLTFSYSYVSSFFVYWPTSVVHVNYTGISSIYSNFWSVVQWKFGSCILTIILDHFIKFTAVIFFWHRMSHNAKQRPDM